MFFHLLGKSNRAQQSVSAHPILNEVKFVIPARMLKCRLSVSAQIYTMSITVHYAA